MKTARLAQRFTSSQDEGLEQAAPSDLILRSVA
jgi:hypothetical protein